MNPSDQRLLELYRTGNDQGAFEQLIQRHGPMVMGVCRRTLDSEQDAWDTFQSVFLVLARKADSLKDHPSISGWLYQVAVRTAMGARTSLLNHASRFQPLEEDMQHESSTPEPKEEWRMDLDEEIQNLPEKYRSPVVLCHVENRTYEEAAGELGLSCQTIQHRLRCARDLLRRRLVRRGVAVTAVSLELLLAQNVLVHVPADIIASTAKAASSLTAGTFATSGAVSQNVLVLMKSALKTIWIQQLKKTALIGLIPTALGIAAIGAWHLLATPADSPPASIPSVVAKPQETVVFQREFDVIPPDNWTSNKLVKLNEAGGEVTAIASEVIGKRLDAWSPEVFITLAGVSPDRGDQALYLVPADIEIRIRIRSEKPGKLTITQGPTKPRFDRENVYIDEIDVGSEWQEIVLQGNDIKPYRSSKKGSSRPFLPGVEIQNIQFFGFGTGKLFIDRLTVVSKAKQQPNRS